MNQLDANFINLHRVAGATKSGYERNGTGTFIRNPHAKRQRPKSKSNFALIKQIKTND